MTQSAGWGAGAWGESAWGVAEEDLALVSARAVRENVVRLTFTTAPLFTGLENSQDAARLDHYSVTTVGGVGLDGEPVRPVLPVLVEVVADEGSSLDVTVDRPFTAYAAVYRVSATGLMSVDGANLLPGQSRTFFGMRAGSAPVGSAETVVAGRDLANPQVARDLLNVAPEDPTASLGTYRIGPDGDYAADRPFASYRKRCVRRVTTRLGGFAHLARYGAGANGHVKRQATARERQLLAEQAEQQIRFEPETLSVTVTVEPGPSATILRVRAFTTLQPDPVEFPILSPLR